MIINKKFSQLTELEKKQINDLEKDLDQLYNIYQKDNEIQFLIKKIQNEIIGFVSYKDLDVSYNIYNIIVKKDYQRQGYAKSLIDKLNQKDIILEVKSNNKALYFYEKQGFKKVYETKYSSKDNVLFYVMLKKMKK